MRSYLKFTWLIVLFSFYSCEDTKEAETSKDTVAVKIDSSKYKSFKNKKEVEVEEEETVNLTLKEEEEKILLTIDSLPLGSSYAKVKEKFPQVKNIRGEGEIKENIALHLTETTAPLKLLNKQGSMEFNFKNDSLYSFYFTISESDPEKGENIYKGLQTFYSSKYGKYTEEPVEEETRYSKSGYWNSKEIAVPMTYNMNTGMISWGFQK